MKRALTILVSLCMVFILATCGRTEAAGSTIYVTGPTPDHGWTAQAGFYAEQKVRQINEEGKYKAVYLPASSGEQQVDLVQQILANGDAAGVVFFALEDSARAGQEALISANIPFIAFDRIIEGPDKSAALNFSGNNWQVGAGIAYWLQQNGLKPGDTLVTLIGDNGTVCTRRQAGFESFLKGEKIGDAQDAGYVDKALGKTFTTTQIWTANEVNALISKYKTVCNWSADGAYQYLEQTLPDIIADAKASGGSLYIFSQDDEMTFGVLNLLEGNVLTDGQKTDLEALNVYISAIGGMQELFNVIDGSAAQAAVADRYFDGLVTLWFSPKMMTTAIDYMIDKLEGKDWHYAVGAGEYEPTWIVGKDNVSQYEGFTGR